MKIGNNPSNPNNPTQENSKHEDLSKHVPICSTNSGKGNFLNRGLEGLEAENSQPSRKIFNKTHSLSDKK
ncbi:MAG: hypothetical protein V4489_03755 [Chlamydiota bacterium]